MTPEQKFAIQSVTHPRGRQPNLASSMSRRRPLVVRLNDSTHPITLAAEWQADAVGVSGQCEWMDIYRPGIFTGVRFIPWTSIKLIEQSSPVK